VLFFTAPDKFLPDFQPSTRNIPIWESYFNPPEAGESARNMADKSSGGGQGFIPPPLGAIKNFAMDTPLLAAG